MKVLFETAVIEKKNQLNELRNEDMTLQELRLFCIYLSKINHMDQSSRKVKFPLSDYVEILGIKKVNIETIKTSVKSLLSKVITVPTERGGFKAFQLFKRSICEKDDNGKWYIEFDAHDEALPLMFDFKDKYFKYELKNILHLKSNIQIRMYEILKQYEKIGKIVYTVDKIKELLGISSKKYTSFKIFKRDVLEVCKKAISENTDIDFEYECAKRGEKGKWLSIRFIITAKNKENIQETDNDEIIEASFCNSEFVIDETDIEEQYGSETLANLAKACDYEFCKSEMELISRILTRIDISKDRNTDSLEWGRFMYLKEKYAALCVEADNKMRNGQRISNRFAYFKGILEKDATALVGNKD